MRTSRPTCVTNCHCVLRIVLEEAGTVGDDDGITSGHPPLQPGHAGGRRPPRANRALLGEDVPAARVYFNKQRGAVARHPAQTLSDHVRRRADVAVVKYGVA